MAASPADLEKLRDELVRLTPDDAVYLAELGWFAIRHYRPYEGRNPRTGERVFVPESTVLFFRAHPNVLQTIQQQPLVPIDDSLHDWNDDRATHHAAWADKLAAWMREQLYATGRCALPGLGTLLVTEEADEDDDDRAAGRRVHWTTDAALQSSLYSRSS